MINKAGAILTVEEKLTEATIAGYIKTNFVGSRIIYRHKMVSTMDTARKEALGGALEGTVIIADEQTAGKGRIGRLWLSPKGCIALSVILYPEAAIFSSIIMVASLAVIHTIKHITKLHPVIKWPNDIMINDKKVCGILVEGGIKEGGKNHVIIGIGINVNLEPECLGEATMPATSLSNELGKAVSRLELICCLLLEIERLYTIVRNGIPVYQEWRRNLETLGRQVYVKTGEEIYDGIAESVEKDGSLLLRIRGGMLKRIIAGDVTLRY